MKRPLTLTLVAAALLAGPAIAGTSQTEDFDLKVSFDRAALDDEAALSGEYDRIRTQVAERCEAENASFNPVRKMIAVRNCVYEAMENTVQKINHDGLTAHHRRKS